MCRASSASEVVKTTARPFSACSVISAKMSALAPMSTPRDGSSSSSTRRPGQQRLADDDLLLVAAAQRADGSRLARRSSP